MGRMLVVGGGEQGFGGPHLRPEHATVVNPMGVDDEDRRYNYRGAIPGRRVWAGR